MEITPAHAEDIDAILDLWGELAEFHAELDPAFTPAAGWRPAYAGYLVTLFDRPDARVLVAREGDEIVGYGVARITPLPPFFADRRRGFIQDVFTHRDYRRRGIARRLVTDLLAWLHEAAVTAVELTVATNNAEAISLWEHLGFRPYMRHYRKAL